MRAVLGRQLHDELNCIIHPWHKLTGLAVLAILLVSLVLSSAFLAYCCSFFRIPTEIILQGYASCEQWPLNTTNLVSGSGQWIAHPNTALRVHAHLSVLFISRFVWVR
jgi:hypothetical protein